MIVLIKRQTKFLQIVHYFVKGLAVLPDYEKRSQREGK